MFGLRKEEIDLITAWCFDLSIAGTDTDFMWFFGVVVMRQFDQLYEVLYVGQEDKAAFGALNHDTLDITYLCGCNS